MNRKPFARDHTGNDRGAALVMAIAVMVAMAALIGALLTLMGNSFRTTAALERNRSEQYAADAAVEQAIQLVRTDSSVSVLNRRALVDTGCSASTPIYAPTPALLNNIEVRVYCVGAPELQPDPDGHFFLQRNVLFIACRWSADSSASAPCPERDVVLQSKVNFRTDAAGEVDEVYVQSWSVS